MLSFSSSTAAQESTARAPARVLVLHSYGFDFRWTLDIDAGIRDVLEEDPRSTTTVHSEPLDAKYHSDKAYMDNVAAFLATKYADWAFDLVIAVDNFALEFVKHTRDSLWPSVPLVFAGINNYRPELVEDLENTTGVAEGLSAEKTVEAMQQLFPTRDKVVILSDVNETGRQNVRIVKRALSRYDLDVAVHRPVSVGSLDGLAGQLGEDTVAILVGLVADRTMTPLDFKKSGRLAAETLDVPVFSLWDFYMTTGIVGGYMTSGKRQGEEAARLAARILGGEDPEAIPVVEESPNVPAFDLQALRPYGVTARDLPPDSVIYNQPLGLWERYRFEILLTISAFLLVVSLGLIGYELARRRTIEVRTTAESLREKETLLREIHHRVKNNLQVISSMLSIQSSLIGDTKALEYFQDARTRIQSMALVHEHLYESTSLARLDLRDYVDELVATVFHSMDTTGGGIRVETDVAEISLDLDHAIPLGMVINELVSNAIKYAYPHGSGEIDVTLSYVEKHAQLEVRDEGVGIPSATLEKRESLGLQLVEALAGQLRGTVSFENTDPGLRVRFDFPVTAAGT